MTLAAQTKADYRGKVLEREGEGAIVGATVSLPQIGLYAITDANGLFTLQNVPQGQTQIKIESFGKLTIESEITVAGNQAEPNIFYMETADFTLEEVTVVATNSKTGASTSSIISRSAIDHLQATSLADVMELLPGQLSSNPTLSSAAKPSLRQVLGDGMNSMGTSIVMNGSPVSNNANLQVGNTATEGVLTTGFTSTAGSGVDMRRISADNIESVYVIRGIPSVEYGDLTSGVIIVNPKAGVSQLQARFKINPTLTQASVGKGFSLGERGGAMSVDVDYASSLADERRPYQGFRRLTANALYTKRFLSNKISTTSGVRFYSDLDAQKLDPTDVRYQRRRSASNTGYNFNTNILWQIDGDFFKSLRLNGSLDYAVQEGYTQEMKGGYNYLVTTAMRDGTVASNRDEQVFYVPTQGGAAMPITNTDREGYGATTNFLPYEFLTKTTTYGKPLNAFLKLTSTMYGELWGFGNRIVSGAEWKSDVNFGQGMVFDPMFPPTSGLRMRPYTEIPALNQISVYAEDNISRTVLDRELNVQLGLRYDIIQPGREDGGGVLSPRFNASFEIVPEVLSIRGGWGVTAKAPPLVYLYPQNAYFDLMNFNNIGLPNVTPEQELSLITTKVYDTSNRELKIAKNQKTELGLDVNIGRDMTFTVTAFRERLENGYSFGYDRGSYNLYELTSYAGTPRVGNYPALSVDKLTNVVLGYNRPLNDRINDTKGVEFDFNFGRIDAIRTSFVLNGAWMRSDTYSSENSFYQKPPENGIYKSIGVYGTGEGMRRERFSTNLRAIHNIPEIGLVVSLSMQTIWNENNKYLGLDNLYPIGYLDVNNNLNYVALAPGSPIDDDIQRRMPESQKITEKYPSLWLFNLRLTKEIKKTLGFTFFINNLFMNQPYTESRRNPGNFVQRNPEQFFGAEVWIKL